MNPLDRPENNIIEVVELTKNFDTLSAVDHISFSFRQGEIFAFLGPNGAGKTTTIKMLTTLLKPSGGRMSLNGHDPARDALGARRSFGIVFQDPSLDDELTAYENLEFHGMLYDFSGAGDRDRGLFGSGKLPLYANTDLRAAGYGDGAGRI